MSGPSATLKPMSAKIAVISSITWLTGWMRPVSSGEGRSGSVTSTRSASSRVASSASLSTARRAAIASVTRSRRPFSAGPITCRSSGVIAPRPLSRSETAPFLPSAATRSASSAASSAAAAMRAVRSCSSAAMSVLTMVFMR